MSQAMQRQYWGKCIGEANANYWQSLLEEMETQGIPLGDVVRKNLRDAFDRAEARRKQREPVGFTPDEVVAKINALGWNLSRSALLTYERQKLIPPPIEATTKRKLYPVTAVGETLATVTFLRGHKHQFKPAQVRDIRAEALTRLQADQLPVVRTSYQEMYADLPCWWMTFRQFGLIGLPVPSLNSERCFLFYADFVHSSCPQDVKSRWTSLLREYAQSSERKDLDAVLFVEQATGPIWLLVFFRGKWHEVWFPPLLKGLKAGKKGNVIETVTEM